MRFDRFAAVAALLLALAPAARLGAQATAQPQAGHHGQHAQHGQAGHAAHHGQHAQHGAAGHAAHHAQGQHGPAGMGCDHGAGGHAATPAMLVTHRADLGLSDAQVQRLQALKQDDAAGAQAVLTAEQKTRIEAVHAAMKSAHHAHGQGAHGQGGHAHGDCADCCRDGRCEGEGCCKDSDCCTDGRCDAEKCRECCARMNAAKTTQAAPRS